MFSCVVYVFFVQVARKQLQGPKSRKDEQEARKWRTWGKATLKKANKGWVLTCQQVHLACFCWVRSASTSATFSRSNVASATVSSHPKQTFNGSCSLLSEVKCRQNDVFVLLLSDKPSDVPTLSPQMSPAPKLTHVDAKGKTTTNYK